MLTAADVMTATVVSVSPETPVPDVARLLYEQRISGVPVEKGTDRWSASSARTT